MNTITLEFGRTICGDDWHVTYNNENFIRFYYIYGGEAHYKEENTAVRLLPGHLYVFLKDKYDITHNPENPLNVLWFHVLIPNIKPSGMKDIPVVADDIVYHLLKTYEQSFLNELKITDESIRLIIRHLEIDYGLFDFYDKEIIKALTYMNQNLDRNICNAEIAKLLNYSEKYFVNYFKKKCGISPQKYIKTYKMEMAANYLKNRFSLDETASLLGYNNTNNFCRDFKIRYKTSPVRYLRERSIKP
ncbi:MAG: helix-turn-helix domain-containing protein [Saccharofermentanales bacterium]